MFRVTIYLHLRCQHSKTWIPTAIKFIIRYGKPPKKTGNINADVHLYTEYRNLSNSSPGYQISMSTAILMWKHEGIISHRHNPSNVISIHCCHLHLYLCFQNHMIFESQYFLFLLLHPWKSLFLRNSYLLLLYKSLCII